MNAVFVQVRFRHRKGHAVITGDDDQRIVQFADLFQVIKHAHHQVEFDVPGKDSYVLRKAGAGQETSQQRFALGFDALLKIEMFEQRMEQQTYVTTGRKIEDGIVLAGHCAAGCRLVDVAGQRGKTVDLPVLQIAARKCRQLGRGREKI